MADRVARARAEIARLREVAQSATQRGGWEIGYAPTVIATRQDDVLGKMRSQQDTAHIAAWDPVFVLGVLDDADATLDRHRRPHYCPGMSPAGFYNVQPCPDALAVLDRYAPEVDCG